MAKKNTATTLLVIGLVIVALVILFSKQGRDMISQVTGGALNIPDFGGLDLPTGPGADIIDFETGRKINGVGFVPPSSDAAKKQGCCCDGGGVSSTAFIFNTPNTRDIPDPSFDILSPAYIAPPCIPGIDFEAMGAPGTVLGDWYRGPRGLKGKHYAEASSAGYAQTVAGWMQYVLDYPRGIAGNQNRSDQVRAINVHTDNYQRCK